MLRELLEVVLEKRRQELQRRGGFGSVGPQLLLPEQLDGSQEGLLCSLGIVLGHGALQQSVEERN